MRISVIIPTFGRLLLRRTLAELTRQTLPAEQVEVLVVDDGSPESPDAIVEAFAGQLPVRLLEKAHGGIPSARNLGAAQATGELLVFLDDDIAPCADFLEEHLAAHRRNPRVVALGALPFPEELLHRPFLYYLEQVGHYDLFKRYGSAERIPMPPLNGNSSVLRRNFEAVGGYDVAFSRYGGEDTELGYRLLRAGLEFVYVPRARGFHYHVKDFRSYKRDMYASGVATRLIVRKHPELFSRSNADIVLEEPRRLRWSKRWRRRLFDFLGRAPRLVGSLERLVDATEHLGWKSVLYPFYLLVGHYYYGLGIRAEQEDRVLDSSPGQPAR